MAPETTTCDACGGQVHLTLDQVLELRVLRCLQCPGCGERLVRMKHPSELAQREQDAA